jgi:hypothetical protein
MTTNSRIRVWTNGTSIPRGFARLALLLTVVTALWSSSLFAPTGRAAAPASCPDSVSWKADTIYANGDFCLSLNGDLLTYQTDGNLVYYINGVPVWNTGTWGVGARLALQGDGNVVIYSASNKALYASTWYYKAASYATPGSTNFLSLNYNAHTHQIANNWEGADGTTGGNSALNGVRWQDLGDQYGCTVESGAIEQDTLVRNLAPGRLCWANTYGTLVFQYDGNFVEYVDGKARWNSGTGGKGAWLAFQGDGNIVIYNASGRPLWAVSTLAISSRIGPWKPQDLAHYNGTFSLQVTSDHRISYGLFSNPGSDVWMGWVY